MLPRLLLAGAAWRLRGSASFLAPDSQSYLIPASSLATHLAFSDGLGRPEVFRTPGYPLFLSAGVAVGHPILFAVLAQIVLVACLIALVFRLIVALGRRPRTALWCAVAVGVEPTLLLWSLKVMSETLFALCLVALASAVHRAMDRRSETWTVLAAACLAAGAFIRPVAYPVALAAVAATLVGCLVRPSVVPRRTAAVAALVCVGGLAAWQVRNAYAAGYAGFSIQIDRAIYVSAAGAVRARVERHSFSDLRQEILAAEQRVDRSAMTTSPFEALRRQGTAIVAAHPVEYARVHAAGMVRTLFDPGAVEYFRTFGRYPEEGGLATEAVGAGMMRAVVDLRRRYPSIFLSTLALGCVTLVYVAAPIVALVFERRRPSAFAVVMAAFTICLVTASGGAPGTSRLRAPMVPLFVVIAAAARPRPLADHRSLR